VCGWVRVLGLIQVFAPLPAWGWLVAVAEMKPTDPTAGCKTRNFLVHRFGPVFPGNEHKNISSLWRVNAHPHSLTPTPKTGVSGNFCPLLWFSVDPYRTVFRHFYAREAQRVKRYPLGVPLRARAGMRVADVIVFT
jgi:hypothetical protein